MISPTAEDAVRRFLEEDDPASVQPAAYAIQHADWFTLDRIEDLIIEYAGTHGDSAGQKVLPIAPLMSAKFHSLGLRQPRDFWKSVAATASSEVDDALAALYHYDDEGEEHDGRYD